ncbi:MAG: hypothetical protein ACXW19_09560, partial [Thermoanaerobaculia bacterium]
MATLIDLARPATATGTISAIRYYWPTGPCPSAFKIKFFHRTGDTLKMSEERGPFGSSTSGPGTIALSAPVAVLEGDLIGITSLTTCGNATALYGSTPSDGYVAYRGDVTGSVTVSGGTRRPDLLPVFGSGSATESVRGVITVAGSTAGGFGSNFKTSVQLLNPLSDGTLTGRIDFRPAGNPERNGALLYSLGPRQIVSFPAIVASMGQSGLGSIDVVVTAGQSAPLFLVRVYNDAGIAGTSGLTEEVVDPEVTLKGVSSLLTRGKSGFLMTPIDP